MVCEITEADKRIQFIAMTQQLFLVYCVLCVVYQAIKWKEEKKLTELSIRSFLYHYISLNGRIHLIIALASTLLPMPLFISLRKKQKVS